MTCPNCGSANQDNAKFCWNCGMTLGGAPQPPYQQPQYPPPPQYQMQPPGGQSTGSKIALGCLIAVLIVMLFFFSCTRACFGRRRYYRFGAAVMIHPLPAAAQNARLLIR
jgi:uncharacterized membrane protein YvbJ